MKPVTSPFRVVCRRSPPMKARSAYPSERTSVSQSVTSALGPKRKWGRLSGEARPAIRGQHECALCGSLDQSKLRQGRHAIVEADLLDNLAVLELQDGRTGELHLASCVGWK